MTEPNKKQYRRNIKFTNSQNRDIIEEEEQLSQSEDPRN
jgi:hypothetical protein